jgi:predicted PurR-regulated permease PerM
MTDVGTGPTGPTGAARPEPTEGTEPTGPGEGSGPSGATPMTERIRHAGQVAWALTGLAVVVVLLVLLGWALRVIWPPLILAGAIVFLLNPIVTWLQRRRVPRALGTGLTYLGAAGVVALAGFLVAPQARDQWDEFADDWPELREEIEDWVDEQARRSRRDDWPVEVPTFEEIEDALAGREPGGGDGDGADRDGDGRTTAAERRAEASERQERLLETVDTARELGLRVFHVGLIFVIGPIIAFYLLVDLPHIRRAAKSLVPDSRRGEVLLVARRLNQAIGGYFRGQLAVAAIVGTLVSIGLAIIGLPFWLVVGLTAGVFNMVPMIGPWIGAVPGVIIALTTRDVGTALWVVVIMAGVQQVDNHFISPVVMQRAVKLHPAVVMLALLAGGTLFGFLGLLLAVPVTAVLKVLLGHLWRTYVLGQPLEAERLAFAAMDAQPGAVVEDVDDRDPALDRIAYPLPGDRPGEPAEPDQPTEPAEPTGPSDPGAAGGAGEAGNEGQAGDEGEEGQRPGPGAPPNEGR